MADYYHAKAEIFES